MTPSVSVIITCYNQGELIEPMARRLLADLGSNDEIVVSDDGSKDDSVSRLQRIAVEDARFRVVTSPPTKSVSRARNRGLAVANGEWVSFLDGDDEYVDGRRAAFGAGLEHCEGADILFSDYLLWYGPDSPLSEVSALDHRGFATAIANISHEESRGWKFVPWHKLTELIIERGSPLIVVNSLFRTEWLRASGVLFDPRFVVAEDTDFMLRAIQGANIYHSAIATARYRISTTGLDSRRDITSVYSRALQRATLLQLPAAALGTTGERLAWRAIGIYEQEVSYVLRHSGLPGSALRLAARSMVARPSIGAVLQVLKSLVTLVTKPKHW